MPSLAATTPAEIVERTALVGLDDLQAALARGRGVVLVTAHVGNWEMGGAALAARGFPLDVVTQRQRSQTFDRLLLKSRQRLGMRVIDRHDAHRAVLRSLRQGRMVAFVADQDAREAGIFVPFFGKPASTHRGPALLALRAGAPLFMGVALRGGRGSYRVELREIEPPDSGRLRDRVNQLTSIFTSEFERVIREAPDQYLWHHRRWKTAPLPTPDAADPCADRAVPVGAEALQHGGEPA